MMLKTLLADTIVMAVEREPYKPLEEGLKAAGLEVSVIGDANGHHDALEAIREAFELCRNI